MKNGSPARQWMQTLDRHAEKWLTPVRYTMASQDASAPPGRPKYLKVTIARVMPPFAIACHYNGREWVPLWIDTREVPLVAIGD